MSYGREPHYIYACACGGEPDELGERPHPTAPHVLFDFVVVPRTALEQFIATAHWRGELAALIDAGYKLRPELGLPSQNLPAAAASKSAKTKGAGGRRRTPR